MTKEPQTRKRRGHNSFTGSAPPNDDNDDDDDEVEEERMKKCRLCKISSKFYCKNYDKFHDS